METIERRSDLWHTGAWRYVVRVPGLALELLLYRNDVPELAVASAAFHVRAVPTAITEPDCELVGGHCDLNGCLMPVLELLDGESRPDPRQREPQPEAFWNALERLLRAKVMLREWLP